MKQAFNSGQRAGKASMMHQANLDQLKELAKTDPVLRYTFDMHEDRGIAWEYCITAAALALAESNKKLRDDLTYVLERTPVPILFPKG